MTEGSVHRGGTPIAQLHHGLEELRSFEHRMVARIREKRVNRDVNRLHDESLTVGQRIADSVAATMGSWRFIIIQSSILLVWIGLNVAAFAGQWDPYPFILLNLALSFQAAYAAPIIMMSQNRQEARDRMRAELDLETDLKAETLIEELHGNVEELRITRWAQLLKIQQRQIEMLTSLVQELVKEHAEVVQLESAVAAAAAKETASQVRPGPHT
jgi:uncharacterized membrane protein